MGAFVALLRGINVGGKNKIKMADLKAIFESHDLQNVQTYIQSGNVVFQANEDLDVDAKMQDVRQAVGLSHGFEPMICCLSEAEFRDAIKDEGFPYPEAKDDPKTLHLYFLKEEALNSDLGLLSSVAKETERYVLTNKVFYLHAPEGIGRSKLALKVERALGVSATARNWRTISKLKEMLDAAA